MPHGKKKAYLVFFLNNLVENSNLKRFTCKNTNLNAGKIRTRIFIASECVGAYSSLNQRTYTKTINGANI